MSSAREPPGKLPFPFRNNGLENALPAKLRCAQETCMTAPCQPARTDRWCLTQNQEIAHFEQGLSAAGN